MIDSLSLPSLTKDCVKLSTSSAVLMVQSKIRSSLISFPDKRLRFKSKTGNSPEFSPPKPETKTRLEMKEEARKKAEECKEFTKKIAYERSLRQKKTQEREKEFRLRLFQEIEELKKNKIENFMFFEEKNKKNLESMRKNEFRKHFNEDLEGDLVRKSFKKPLFKQIEENYKNSRVLPQLELQKAELAKKHVLFKPLDPEELAEHSKKHDELKKIQDYRRKKQKEQKINEMVQNENHFSSKFTEAVLENDRKAKEDLEKSREEKIINAQKRLQYSKLVKEMFIPETEEKKVLSKKSLNSSKSGENLFELNSKLHLNEVKKEVKTRKRKEMTPEQVKIVPDYIAEFRQRREINEKDDKQVFDDIFNGMNQRELSQAKVQKIIEKTEFIEQRAKRKELRLDDLKFKSKKGIQTGEEVNEMIINTIRAKLALLDKLQTDS
jgi:hypothetical protein